MEKGWRDKEKADLDDCMEGEGRRQIEEEGWSEREQDDGDDWKEADGGRGSKLLISVELGDMEKVHKEGKMGGWRDYLAWRDNEYASEGERMEGCRKG